MGLPAKWTDAEHGLCLALWPAVTYLRERGVIVTVEKNVLYRLQPGQAEAQVIVEPVQITAVGAMYPVSLLDGLCK